MRNKLIKKIKDKKGTVSYYLLLGLVIIYGLIIYITYNRDNAIYEWQTNNFRQGLSNATKAGILQIDRTDSNIAKGFIIGENQYNSIVKINHNRAIDMSLVMLSLKTGYTINELKLYTKIVFIEPIRLSPNNYKLKVNMYTNGKKNKLLDDIICDSLLDVINAINNKLDKIKIKMQNDSKDLIRNIEVKTYLIIIIENFPLRSYVFDESKIINMYYYEGTNLVRK